MRLTSLADIFESTFSAGQNDVTVQRIEIPPMQRDYAQGRLDLDTTRIRRNFIAALKDALVRGTGINLDIVYGSVDDDGTLILLDGQQRLTMLYLLSWYLARKEQAPSSELSFLSKFTYDTRDTAEAFMRMLSRLRTVDFFAPTISDQIKDQGSFHSNWMSDPTVQSMLVTLDDLHAAFRDTQDLWPRLRQAPEEAAEPTAAITFYFLPLSELGLTDELYVKMNSRGRPLTSFEQFKAELQQNLREADWDLSQRIARKIDGAWTEWLWAHRGEKEETPDSAFLNYLAFVSRIMGYERAENIQNMLNDPYALLNRFFKVRLSDNETVQGKGSAHSAAQVQSNAENLEAYFDSWVSPLGLHDADDFFDKLREADATGVNRQIIGGFKEAFDSVLSKAAPTVRDVLRMYTLTSYVRDPHRGSIAQFLRRMRIIHNLLANSEFEIDEKGRIGVLPDMLRQIQTIVKTGQLNDTLGPQFNVHQVAEEAEKIVFLERNPEQQEILFRLENHPLLYGQIGIIGLEHLDLAEKFEELFPADSTRQDYDGIDQALVAVSLDDDESGVSSEFYGQSSDHGNNRLTGRKEQNWKDLFHRSNARGGFDRTSAVLQKLLQENDELGRDSLENLAESYIAECEVPGQERYDWKYYYLKYPVFRDSPTGRLRWHDFENEPYRMWVLAAEKRLSSKAYNPFLKAAIEGLTGTSIDPGSIGEAIWLDGDRRGKFTTDAFVAIDENGDILEEIFKVPQDDGIDGKDRVQMLREYLKTLNLKDNEEAEENSTILP